jgi:hypothetical protein
MRYATRDQVQTMKGILLANNLFDGHYDRLWKLLEVHEIDVRTPGDGTRMPYDTAVKTIAWLRRQLAKQALYKEVAVHSQRRDAAPLN